MFVKPVTWRRVVKETTTILNNLLTTEDVCSIFHVGRQTIWNWRHQEEDPLPCILITGNERHNVRFDHKDVIRWAKRNEKEVDDSEIPSNVL
jgi:phage terminase Nu1 subunit (DNA packaging protein)